jgi:hypothetical protein
MMAVEVDFSRELFSRSERERLFRLAPLSSATTG